MKKILLVIQREYLSRVKKKSFVIMTIVGPVLMASLFIAIILLSQVNEETRTIAVIDENILAKDSDTSRLFHNSIPNTEGLKFVYTNKKIEDAKVLLKDDVYFGVLYIPDVVLNAPNSVKLYTKKQAGFSNKIYIENALKKHIENIKLSVYGIRPEILQAAKTDVKIATIKIEENGIEKKSASEIISGIGYVAGFLIYIFIFMYGAQVMRGVIEEKSNRIVEVIISSLKPFQLMIGKIIGIAFVGLTQFVLWIILTFSIVTIFQSAFPEKFATQKEITYSSTSKKLPNEILTNQINLSDSQIEVNELLEGLKDIKIGLMIFSFIFYFICGYLLYSSLFAAIGSAVDNEADTQQFMIPLTIPLVLALVMAQFVINNPDGPLAFWFSMIPFTSPVVMMIRIPFGVSYLELAMSAFLLIIGFMATTWMASKIYRTGILMYGKKVSYKELWKWLTYKS